MPRVVAAHRSRVRRTPPPPTTTTTTTNAANATNATPAAKATANADANGVKPSVTQVVDAPRRGVTPEDLAAIAAGVHADPHAVLGAHKSADGKKTTVRALAPAGASVTLVYTPPARINRVGLSIAATEKRVPMKADAHGVFTAEVGGGAGVGAYHFEIDGKRVEDPYSFAPSVKDADMFLFKEGTLEDTARLLGSHEMTLVGKDGKETRGFNFVVWAPNARGISVVGDFNGWDPSLTPMRKLGGAVFEVFVPDVRPGEKYMFSVATSTGGRVMKADPAAFASELRPGKSSITLGASSHEWSDAAWMQTRAATDPLKAPISTYEVHLPSWKKNDDGSVKSYRQLADELVPHLQKHKFNAIELVGLAEHPLDDSWGYQVTGYFAPTARHGSPEDFKYFVDKMHQAGVRVMYDWVPAHYPKDGHALDTFDGTHLFDHQDDRLGAHMDWGTRIFNYARNEVKSFLIGGLTHMLDEFHIDGVRVDAVASMLYRDYSRKDWIPNEDGSRENREAIAFLRDVNERVGNRFPGVLRIAEESTAFPGVTTPVKDGGLGFDLKWNMGWMHDTLEFFKTPTKERGNNLDRLTNTLLWAHSEKFVAALSHDEVVHLKRSLVEKMPGDDWQKRANLRVLFGYMFSYPGQKLLFMGSELAQHGEWNFKSELDWKNADGGMGKLLADLNALYESEPALSALQFDPKGNEAFHLDKTDAVVGMVRHAPNAKDDVVFLHNLTETPRTVRVGLDHAGAWREILNTDDQKYGGSGVGNKKITVEKVAADGKPYSAMLTLPPLATIALKR